MIRLAAVAVTEFNIIVSRDTKTCSTHDGKRGRGALDAE